MSRSYRKNPVLTGRKTAKSERIMANQIIRARIKTGKYDSPHLKPSAYKRIFESWEIHDIRVRKSPSDVRKEIDRFAQSPNEAWIKYKKEWLGK